MPQHCQELLLEQLEGKNENMKIILYLALLICSRASVVVSKKDVKLVETGTARDGKEKLVLDLFV